MTTDVHVIPLKEKYRASKTVGRYKGGSNNSTTKKSGQRKKSPQAAPDFEVVLVIRDTGKKAWIRRLKVQK